MAMAMEEGGEVWSWTGLVHRKQFMTDRVTAEEEAELILAEVEFIVALGPGLSFWR